MRHLEEGVLECGVSIHQMTAPCVRSRPVTEAVVYALGLWTPPLGGSVLDREVLRALMYVKEPDPTVDRETVMTEAFIQRCLHLLPTEGEDVPTKALKQCRSRNKELRRSPESKRLKLPVRLPHPIATTIATFRDPCRRLLIT